VAVNKPAGQLVHPAEAPADGDLVTMKILRDQIGHSVYVLHRLNRPTSGALLLAVGQLGNGLSQRRRLSLVLSLLQKGLEHFRRAFVPGNNAEFIDRAARQFQRAPDQQVPENFGLGGPL